MFVVHIKWLSENLLIIYYHISLGGCGHFSDCWLKSYEVSVLFSQSRMQSHIIDQSCMVGHVQSHIRLVSPLHLIVFSGFLQQSKIACGTFHKKVCSLGCQVTACRPPYKMSCGRFEEPRILVGKQGVKQGPAYHSRFKVKTIKSGPQWKHLRTPSIEW